MTRVMEDMHCQKILIGYGETEASPLTHLTDRNDSLESHTETVGRNLPHQGKSKLSALTPTKMLPWVKLAKSAFVATTLCVATTANRRKHRRP